MKGSHKKWQSNTTESVIGMLMGFDNPPPQPLIPNKTRVLSEAYISNVASISLRPGSSVSAKHLRTTNNETVDRVKGVSRIHSSNVLDKCVNLSSSNTRSSLRRVESPLFRNRTEHCTGRRVLRHHQKLVHDSFSGFDFVNNSLHFAKDKHFHSSSNFSGLKLNLEKAACDFECVKFDKHVSGCSHISCTKSMSRISPPEKRKSKFEEVLKAECKEYDHDLDRHKTAKRVQRYGVSEEAKKLDAKLANDYCSPSRSSVLLNKTSETHTQPSPKNPESSISYVAAECKDDDSYVSEATVDAEDFTRINGDHLLLELGGYSSDVEEFIIREASLNEFSEEETAYSKCSGIENLKRTSQHSPDSVLKSHDTNNPSPFGLVLQLQALNFESDETLSEDSAFIVSGYEDSEELFGDLSDDGRTIKRWLEEEESRNFSYLVDVLDESGLYENSFIDFNKWDSLESPISPLVFNTLEKKYRKQVSSQKFERQLLFDRINSGLFSIYYPFINFHRKICSSFSRDDAEEELWTILIAQENEKSKDLSEKALDKGWEFKEGVSIISEELEKSIFDDLVTELARSLS